MEKAGKLVLCVCLTFMLIGSTKEETTACNNCSAAETHMTMATNSVKENGTTRPPATTPLPDRRSTHVTTDHHTNSTSTTRPHPSSTSTVSTTSTTVTTSSRKPTVSKGVTQNPESTNHTTGHSPNGTVGIKPSSVSAVTLKGGSSSLFMSCSQLLVPIISILIYGA